MANIARLGVALGLNSAEFVTGIDAASRKLDNFGAAAIGVAKNAVAVLTAAFVAATFKAISYADEIADVAAANDIAIDSIIKLTNALENSGGKGENAGKMIASFTDFVDKAAKGSFEGQKTFSDLGISLQDIGKMSTQQLLQKTTQAIADMEDSLTRNAPAADVFGKSAKSVDMVDFAKGFKDGTGATLEQEQAIKDAAQAFDTFRSIGRDIALLILTSIGPQLKAVADYMKSASSETSAFGVVFGSVFKTIAHGMSDLAFITKGFSDDIGHAIKSLESLTLYLMTGQLSKGFEKFAQDVKEYNKKRKQAREELDAFQQQLLGNETKTQRMGTGFQDPRIVTPDDDVKREVKTPKEVLAKNFELEKAKLANQYAVTNNLIKSYELEANQIKQEQNKAYAEARLEIKQKNITEENKFESVNANILKEKLLSIDKNYLEKIAELKYKYKQEEIKKDFDLDKLRLENQFSGIVKYNDDEGKLQFAFLSEESKIEQEYKGKTAQAILANKQKNIQEENQFISKNALELTHKLGAIDAEYYANKKARADKYREEEAQRNLDQKNEINEILNKEEIRRGERQKVITDIAAQSRAQLVNLEMAQELFLIDQKSRYMKNEDVQLEKELLQIKYKYDEVVLSIYNNEKLTEGAKEIAYALENRNLELTIALAKERRQILKDQKSGGMMEGFLFRMETFGKDMETSFEAGGKAFDSMMSNMSNGLEEFVRKGELDFNKFAGSIIKDMLAIQLRASATNLFSMLAKSFVSTVTGGSPTYSSMPAGVRAEGGPVESNSPYIVGERGPELFVPRSAGAIVPNHSMAMMGGSTNVTNYNIQAIDTKSFEDRILGSSKAIWAANAYGAKNLSLGRGRT